MNSPAYYYFDNSLFGWGIKDSDSRYVYGNRILCQYFSITANQLVGSLDTELIPDIRQYYDHILADDKKILTTSEMSIVLKTFDYGRQDKLRSFLVEKRPWRLDNDTNGIACTYIEIINVYFSSFLMANEGKPLIFNRPKNIFTDKEWEVVLLLKCGVRKNIMPDILGISFSALRNRLTRCYDKTGVTNSSALLRHCIQRGWDNYIPPYFLTKGYVSFF
ncbi:PAS fold-containing protein [Izhakiella capsodis]|uniref:PAS fold-containing protein n=1 Tax=Izhakiella capsodis TaxID=1367852 RepID=A0A1I4VR21_9GAMM|nr:PAS domain-containing protein [Izhakiella capsodis]SFN03752.1 PAS fold-containing protein [Izhakiella capsodis]